MPAEFALNRSLAGGVFHPTCLVNFRQRLVENEQSALIFRRCWTAFGGGIGTRQSKQTFDATQSSAWSDG